jgi:hypothetical protein
VGQSDGPAASQEGELGALQQLLGQRLGEGGAGVGDGGAGVQAEVGAEQGERGGGEAGLHHRAFVGVAEDDDVVGRRHDGRLRVGGDRGRGGTSAQPREEVEDLGGGAGSGEGDDPVVGAVVRELGGGVGVRLAVAGPLTQCGGRLRHEEGGAASDDRDAFAPSRQLARVPGDFGRGSCPALGLAGQLVLDVGHAPPPRR